MDNGMDYIDYIADDVYQMEDDNDFYDDAYIDDFNDGADDADDDVLVAG